MMLVAILDQWQNHTTPTVLKTMSGMLQINLYCRKKFSHLLASIQFPVAIKATSKIFSQLQKKEQSFNSKVIISIVSPSSCFAFPFKNSNPSLFGVFTKWNLVFRHRPFTQLVACRVFPQAQFYPA